LLESTTRTDRLTSDGIPVFDLPTRSTDGSEITVTALNALNSSHLLLALHKVKDNKPTAAIVSASATSRSGRFNKTQLQNGLVH